MVIPLKYYTTFKTDWGFCGCVFSKNTMHRFFLSYPSKPLLQQAIAEAFGELAFTIDGQIDLQKGVTAYFSDQPVGLNISPNNNKRLFDGVVLDISGETVFAQQVIKTLATISIGDTIAYGQLAEKAGFSGSARAVGSVMRRNQFPLLIPCHRVVPAETKTVGKYSAMGGTSFKEKLLAHEAIIAMHLPRCL